MQSASGVKVAHPAYDEFGASELCVSVVHGFVVRGVIVVSIGWSRRPSPQAGRRGASTDLQRLDRHSPSRARKVMYTQLGTCRTVLSVSPCDPLRCPSPAARSRRGSTTSPTTSCTANQSTHAHPRLAGEVQANPRPGLIRRSGRRAVVGQLRVRGWYQDVRSSSISHFGSACETISIAGCNGSGLRLLRRAVSVDRLSRCPETQGRGWNHARCPAVPHQHAGVPPHRRSLRAARHGTAGDRTATSFDATHHADVQPSIERCSKAVVGECSAVSSRRPAAPAAGAFPGAKHSPASAATRRGPALFRLPAN